MNSQKKLAVSFLLAMVAFLLSNSVFAQSASYARKLCADAITERCINTAYHQLRENGSQKQWRRLYAACERDYLTRQAYWIKLYEKYPAARVLGQGPDQASAVAQTGCENTLQIMSLESRVGRMDAEFVERRRIAALEAERKKRQDAVTRLNPLGPNDVAGPKNPLPGTEQPAKRQLTPAEANEAIAQFVAAAAVTNAALAAPAQPPAKRHVRNATAANGYDFRTQRYQQWLARHPNAAANNGGTKEAPSTDTKILCLPKNVELIKKEADHVLLFIKRGADITELSRCFPGYNFNAKTVASENIAAATIVFRFEHPDKPIVQNKLIFHPERWTIKRQDWNKPGSEFYAEWFREYKDDEIGFALQGGQRLKLSVRPNDDKEANPQKLSGSSAPNEHGAIQFEDAVTRMAFASASHAKQQHRTSVRLPRALLPDESGMANREAAHCAYAQTAGVPVQSRPTIVKSASLSLPCVLKKPFFQPRGRAIKTAENSEDEPLYAAINEPCKIFSGSNKNEPHVSRSGPYAFS